MSKGDRGGLAMDSGVGSGSRVETGVEAGVDSKVVARADAGARFGSERPQVIFMGNGPLAEAALGVLEKHFEVIFHARTKGDLTEVVRLKRANPHAYGVLASYGVIIPREVLEAFEPEGILNIHPSLLPKYRGPSPIESAILAGERDFGVSVMKLAPAMDAGPIYWQTEVKGLNTWDGTGVDDKTLENSQMGADNASEAKMGGNEQTGVAKNGVDKKSQTGVATGEEKARIYQVLAETGAEWLSENLENLPTPAWQDDKKATFTAKLTKKMGLIDPTTETAEEILRKIVAFSGFPKVKYALEGQNLAILAAHRQKQGERAPLILTCADGQNLVLDRMQPDGRKIMDARSYANGYLKRK